MRKFFINPLCIYSISFFISLCLYHLKWSDLYPELTEELVIFLGATIFISFLLSFIFNLFIESNRYDVTISKRNSYGICSLITLGFLLEYIYSGQIPILSVLLGSELNYKEFGIPIFHVFLLPYTSIFSIVSFFRFVENINFKYFLYSALYSIFLILTIMNRGALVIIFLAITLILFYKYFSLKYLLIIFLLSGIFLYGFGALGNKRMISSGYQDEWAVLYVGEATTDFKDNWIPKEFFWGYLYSTVSIANLENQMGRDNEGNISDIIVLEILPDFISKRLYSDEKIENLEPILIKEELNTYTVYGRALRIYGILGAVIMFIWMNFFCLVTTILSPRKYRIPILASVSTVTALSVFANMFAFAGTLLQVLLAMVLLSFSTKRLSLL